MARKQIEPRWATGFLEHACGCGAARACGGCLIFAHFVAILLEFLEVAPLITWQISYLHFSRACNRKRGILCRSFQLDPSWSSCCLLVARDLPSAVLDHRSAGGQIAFALAS